MDEIPELIRKLKALADQGVGGEKINAEAALNKALKKHGLTLQDIEHESKRIYYFRIPPDLFLLFQQICYAVSSVNRYIKDSTKKGKIGFELTASEVVEIQVKFDVLGDLYREELKVFFNAFAIRNQIINTKVVKSVSELTPEELEKYKRARGMADSIKKADIQKRLQS